MKKTNKVKSYEELNPKTKGWIFARLKYNETIPQIAKHFNVSVITVNRIIEERIKKLKELRAQLVSIYTQFISSLAIPELNDENIPNENLEDYISDEDNLNTIISDQLDIGNITEAQDSNRTDTDPLDVDPEETPPIIPKSIIYKKFSQ